MPCTEPAPTVSGDCCWARIACMVLAYEGGSIFGTRGDFIPWTTSAFLISCGWTALRLTGDEDDEDDEGTGGGGDGVFEFMLVAPALAAYPFCSRCVVGDDEVDPSPVFC